MKPTRPHPGWPTFRKEVQRLIESGGCECPTQKLHIEHVIDEAERLWHMARNAKEG